MKIFHLLTLGLLVIGALTGGAAFAKGEGVILTQSRPFAGDYGYLYISPQGIKILSGTLHSGTVFAAPTWDKVNFNDQEHTYFRSPYKGWSAQEKQNAGINEPTQPGGKPQVISGFKCVPYLLRRSKGDQSPMMAAMRANEVDVWVTSDIALPATMAESLGATYGLRGVKGVPVRAACKTVDGRVVKLLETSKVTRTVVPASTFQNFASYRLCTNPSEVLMDANMKASVNQLLDQIKDKRAAAQMGSLLGVKRPGGGASVPQTREEKMRILNELMKSARKQQ